jgi:L-asparaginase II
MRLPAFEPLAGLSRGNIPEIVIYGSVVTKTMDQSIKGDSHWGLITRSLSSPWQFMACDIDGKDSFWTIGLALHSGQTEHMEALDRLGQSSSCGEEELICPREYPIDPQVMASLKLQGQKPKRLHHPNSGKHLLMLYTCQKEGYPIHSYWDNHHPLQRKIYSQIGKEAAHEIRWVMDGCGLPSPVMTAAIHLNMWERFVLDESKKATHVKDLWLRYPELVGGRGRLDTDLILACEGRALIKEGSDGLFLIQSLPGYGEDPSSVLIKLAGGYHRTHMALGILSAIYKNPGLPKIFQRIEEYLRYKLDDWLKPGVKLIPFDLF